MPVAPYLFDPNPELWNLDDKYFVAHRKREWKSILPRINILRSQGRFDNETMSGFKRYFFKGGEYPLRDTSYWSDILMQYWLHPNPDLHNVELNKETQVFPLDWTQGISLFFSKIMRKCPDVSEYGVMGGREADLVLFYNKGYDFQTYHEYGNGQKLPSCLEPYSVGRWFVRAVIMELSLNTGNGNYVAHSPGTVLIDQFDYAMDIYPEAVFDPTVFSNRKMSEQDLRNSMEVVEKTKAEMQSSLRSLLVFPATSGFSELKEKRPASAKRIEDFIDRYEMRQFRPGLLEFMDGL